MRVAVLIISVLLLVVTGASLGRGPVWGVAFLVAATTFLIVFVFVIASEARRRLAPPNGNAEARRPTGQPPLTPRACEGAPDE